MEQASGEGTGEKWEAKEYWDISFFSSIGKLQYKADCVAFNSKRKKGLTFSVSSFRDV